MPDRLPLFPLGMVLLPGLLLPLHVFEQRYRDLVRDLLELPEPERRFGVVAIREGREVGADGVTALHEVGCVAQLRRVTPYEDGRFDIVATGAQRFRLTGLADGAAYATGLVEWLPDELGQPDEAALLDRAVRTAFAAYLDGAGAGPRRRRARTSASCRATAWSCRTSSRRRSSSTSRTASGCSPRPDGVARLRAELALLRREATLLRTLTALPAPELARAPVSPN